MIRRDFNYNKLINEKDLNTNSYDENFHKNSTNIVNPNEVNFSMNSSVQNSVYLNTETKTNYPGMENQNVNNYNPHFNSMQNPQFTSNSMNNMNNNYNNSNFNSFNNQPIPGQNQYYNNKNMNMNNFQNFQGQQPNFNNNNFINQQFPQYNQINSQFHQSNQSPFNNQPINNSNCFLNSNTYTQQNFQFQNSQFNENFMQSSGIDNSKLNYNYPVNPEVNYDFIQTTNYNIDGMNSSKPVLNGRVYELEYKQGNYNQELLDVNEDHAPTSDVERYFLELPGKQLKGFDLKVDAILMRCPNATIEISKDKITCSHPIVFDLKSTTMRIVTPTFEENRILMKDGNSIVNGFYVNDFDSNKILLRNKEEIKTIENNFSTVSQLHVFGDFCKVIVDDGFFDGKEVDFKARGLSNISLGKSKVKSFQSDSKMAKVDEKGIIKEE